MPIHMNPPTNMPLVSTSKKGAVSAHTTQTKPEVPVVNKALPALPAVNIRPNSEEEKALLQQLAKEPYGAKPVLMLNELNMEANPDVGPVTPTKLKNGTQAYLQQALNRPTASVEFVLPMFPDDTEMHLSNNVLLNGTLAKKKLLADLQAKGISVETLVTQDHFTLLINGPSGQEKKLLALGLDFLKNPEIDEKEYESSRTLVMQNLLNLSNKPDFQKAETVQRARVGDDHPYGKSTLKTIMEVKDLDPQKTIQEFKASYAHPELTKVAMVSGLAPSQQAALLNSLVEEKGWKTDDVIVPPKSLVKIPPVTPKTLTAPILISDNRLDRVHMSTLWQAPEVGTEDYPKFIILKNLMGGMTGSLFKTMRTERGLVYSTSSGVDANKHYGEFEVSAEIDKDKLPTAIEAQQDAINTYVKTPPTDAELAKVKRKIIHTLRDLDSTSDGILSGTSNRLRDGLPPISREALQAGYMKVSSADVQKTAQAYLGDSAWRIQALTGDEKVLAEQFPSAEILQREHYLTDNVDTPQKGHIYVKKGEEPMYPAEYVLEKQVNPKEEASSLPTNNIVKHKRSPKSLNVSA
ncbi:MAG: insulinase family protein [Vampirovibrionales bacterium]|nr:insulinase family protein [Vampirovibrionales bacterium]